MTVLYQERISNWCTSYVCCAFSIDDDIVFPFIFPANIVIYNQIVFRKFVCFLLI